MLLFNYITLSISTLALLGSVTEALGLGLRTTVHGAMQRVCPYSFSVGHRQFAMQGFVAGDVLYLSVTLFIASVD